MILLIELRTFSLSKICSISISVFIKTLEEIISIDSQFEFSYFIDSGS